MVRDVGLAEDLAQDGLVAALEQWSESGVPDNPGAWLMAIAKRRAIDLFRRRERLERKIDELGHERETRGEGAVPEVGAAFDDDVGDDLLRLVFISCHPVLSTEARVALTLRLLGGLTTEEIARAFLVSVPTVAQRIVRAKRTLAQARIPFEVPHGSERAARLSSVLEVLVPRVQRGYSATAGDDWMRPALCEEALRLGRVLGTAAQLPMGPPLSLVMTTVDDRGRPPAAPCGQELNSLGLAGLPGLSSGRSPGCWIPTNMACSSGVTTTPVISHCRGPTRKRRVSPVDGSAHSIWLLPNPA